MYIRAPKRGQFTASVADGGAVRAGEALLQYDAAAETNLLSQLNAALTQAQRTQEELGPAGNKRNSLIGVADASVAKAKSRCDATGQRLEVNRDLLQVGQTVNWLVTQSKALDERASYELVKAECERRLVEHSADEAVIIAKSLSAYLDGAINALKEQIASLEIKAPIAGRFHLITPGNTFSDKGVIVGNIS